jgi:hypothetical protein
MPSNFKKPLDKVLINVKAGWHGVRASGTPKNGGSFLMFFKKLSMFYFVCGKYGVRSQKRPESLKELLKLANRIK